MPNAVKTIGLDPGSGSPSGSLGGNAVKIYEVGSGSQPQNVLSNPDFSNGSASWNAGSSWSIAVGSAILDVTTAAGAGRNLTQTGVLKLGESYQVSVTVSGNVITSVGTVSLLANGVSLSPAFSSGSGTGTASGTFTAVSQDFVLSYSRMLAVGAGSNLTISKIEVYIQS